MKHFILFWAFVAPTLAHAVYHEEERRFLCIGAAWTALDVIEDGKHPIWDVKASDHKYVITLKDDQLVIKSFNNDERHRYPVCHQDYDDSFACHEPDVRSEMFYFSTAGKRFLQVSNSYTIFEGSVYEPTMVGGDCAEF